MIWGNEKESVKYRLNLIFTSNGSPNGDSRALFYSILHRDGMVSKMICDFKFSWQHNRSVMEFNASEGMSTRILVNFHVPTCIKSILMEVFNASWLKIEGNIKQNLISEIPWKYLLIIHVLTAKCSYINCLKRSCSTEILVLLELRHLQLFTLQRFTIYCFLI